MRGLKIESTWKLVMVLGLALVALSEVRAVHGAQLSPTQCKEERRLAVNMCKPIVFGQPPPPGCCERVRLSHYQCVCPIFTPRVANLITVNKAIKLFQSCGRRVPHNFKCGSLYFP
ncbi:uncharacterized protein LOC115737032 [Rhodamnia argentea]|uniref:Uncharacterized protein LOC115737032 n=1 Tax=Rhodamnia argentea TaxID=178133 RepID=A0A8B8NSF1_9MYRT|nr:uncharacterized protein LOC115737032 [Rhodamnia argentea]